MKKLFKGVVITLLVIAGYFTLALKIPSLGIDTKEAFKEIAKAKDTYEEAKGIYEDIKTASLKNVSPTPAIPTADTSSKEDTKEIGTQAYEKVRITYIDVGQGDSILIENNGCFALIDTGSYIDNNVFDVLEEYKVKEIDSLILTHNDADHIGNASELIYNYPVKNIYMSSEERDTKVYKNLISAIKNNYGDINVYYPTLGDTIRLGNISFDVLGPVKDKHYEDSNSYSIILKLVNGRDSFLFTGDATGEEVEDAMEYGADFKADVLKLAHHGSANCGCNSENFLNTVDANVYIVSCGLDNEYGHPHIETMQYASTNGIHLFRTDLQGSIVCVSVGNKITWNKKYTDNYLNGNNL